MKVKKSRKDEIFSTVGLAKKLIGGFVQTPVSKIYGLVKDTVVMSLDAAALYPTIQMYMNLDYRTFQGKIFEPYTVEKVFKKLHPVMRDDITIEDKKILINDLKNTIYDDVEIYISKSLKRDKKGDKKNIANIKDVRSYLPDYIVSLYAILILSGEKLKDVINPKTDDQYYLLKSYLLPLLENVQKMDMRYKNISSVAKDFLYSRKKFHSEYSDKKIYVATSLHSVHTKFEIMSRDRFYDYIGDKILGIYGVLYDRHDTNLGDDTVYIKEKLDGRSYVKNGMLFYIELLEKVKSETLSVAELESVKQNIFGNFKKIEYDNTVERIWGISLKKYKIRDIEQLFLLSIPFKDDLIKTLELEIGLRDTNQKSRKVAVNSVYGTFGLWSWIFSNPSYIASTFTTEGQKSLKMVQNIAIEIITRLKVRK
jgi:hypothetical protein